MTQRRPLSEARNIESEPKTFRGPGACGNSPNHTGTCPIVLYSVYGHTVRGWCSDNEGLIEAITDHTGTHSLPWMAMDDWSMHPDVPVANGVPKKLRARTVANVGMETCIAPESARHRLRLSGPEGSRNGHPCTLR